MKQEIYSVLVAQHQRSDIINRDIFTCIVKKGSELWVDIPVDFVWVFANVCILLNKEAHT